MKWRQVDQTHQNTLNHAELILHTYPSEHCPTHCGNTQKITSPYTPALTSGATRQPPTFSLLTFTSYRHFTPCSHISSPTPNLLFSATSPRTATPRPLTYDPLHRFFKNSLFPILLPPLYLNVTILPTTLPNPLIPAPHHFTYATAIHAQLRH